MFAWSNLIRGQCPVIDIFPYPEKTVNLLPLSLPPSAPLCVCVCLPIKDLYVYSNCGGQSGDIIYCYCCWLSLSTHTNTQHSFFHYFRNHTYTGTLWQHKFFYSRTRTNMVACKTRTHQCLHLHIKSFNTETKPAQTALIEENTHPHVTQ